MKETQRWVTQIPSFTGRRIRSEVSISAKGHYPWPGSSFYDGELVLGGGWIKEVYWESLQSQSEKCPYHFQCSRPDFSALDRKPNRCGRPGQAVRGRTTLLGMPAQEAVEKRLKEITGYTPYSRRRSRRTRIQLPLITSQRRWEPLKEHLSLLLVSTPL
jgi:hypothetical protein